MDLIKNYNLSYWELKHYFKPYDLIVIGAGIVGLNAAISYKKSQKKAKILVVDKGVFPEGASTKNAGFACFGSPGELLDDLNKSGEKLVFDTIELRWNGLKLLRQRLGDSSIDFKRYGGYELFTDKKQHNFCLENLPYLNKMLKEITGKDNCYNEKTKIPLSLSGIKGCIFNSLEGQIDPGFMMKNLLKLALQNDIEVLYNVKITEILQPAGRVELKSSLGVFKSKNIIVATNGFANELLKLDVKPARAQVLITKPIAKLSLKGTYHLEEGFYYFRNIDNRILLGGGRNLDLKGEQTTAPDLNETIQRRLDQLLREIILPNKIFEVDMRWTGIMGVGKEKKPIIKAIGTNCIAAVRMGGMGVAIGSLVGHLAAKEIAG